MLAYLYLIKERNFVYISQTIADRIKLQAKKKKISLGNMLSEIGLGINIISQFAKGSEMSSITLAKIADYLDCSVDYLLCRTENPNAHKTHENDVAVNPYDDQQLVEIINIYKQLDNVGKARMLVTADELKRGKSV